MKCPHCGKSVGIFSRELNRWGKHQCPHCQEPVKISFDVRVPGVFIVPAIVLGVLTVPTLVYLGVPDTLALVLFFTTCVLLGMRLKPL
jgi:DNA-directed RNA polymerase subunit RPC12/RpoP